MKEVLTHLSFAAAEKAGEEGRLAPHERPEFLHLPMKVVRSVPIFDPERMRPDQIEDTVAALERIVGPISYGKAPTAIETFIKAWGKTGFRLQDAVEHTGTSSRTVRRVLQEMLDAGTIQFREEKTRGKGSRRKRYFTTDRYNDADANLSALEAEDLTLVPEVRRWGSDVGTGVIHHGAGVYGVTSCGCPQCTYAFRDALIGEAVSQARRNGGTGFGISLTFYAADQAAIRRAGGL